MCVCVCCSKSNYEPGNVTEGVHSPVNLREFEHPKLLSDFAEREEDAASSSELILEPVGALWRDACVISGQCCISSRLQAIYQRPSGSGGSRLRLGLVEPRRCGPPSQTTPRARHCGRPESPAAPEPQLKQPARPFSATTNSRMLVPVINTNDLWRACGVEDTQRWWKARWSSNTSQQGAYFYNIWGWLYSKQFTWRSSWCVNSNKGQFSRADMCQMTQTEIYSSCYWGNLKMKMLMWQTRRRELKTW